MGKCRVITVPLGKAQVVGNLKRVARGHGDVLRVTAPAMQADVSARDAVGFQAFDALLAAQARNDRNRRHAIAEFESFDAAADFDHFAGGIDAGHVGQLNRHRILAGAHDAIERAVDRDRANSDNDLARAGFRLGSIRVVQDLRSAEFSDDNSFHAFLEFRGAVPSQT